MDRLGDPSAKVRRESLERKKLGHELGEGLDAGRSASEGGPRVVVGDGPGAGAPRAGPLPTGTVTEGGTGAVELVGCHAGGRLVAPVLRWAATQVGSGTAASRSTTRGRRGATDLCPGAAPVP